MNQEESLALFNKGKDAWNDWAAGMLERRTELKKARTWTSSEDETVWNEVTKAWFATTTADFSHHEFKEHADFSGVLFPGDALFREAIFSRNAWFKWSTFSRDTRFDGAKFRGEARFGKATFSGNVWFDKAFFSGYAGFWKATFWGNARLCGATFCGDALFYRATFSDGALYDGATFSGDTNFRGATFSGNAWFGEATFSGAAQFPEATFEAVTSFHDTQFKQATYFSAIECKSTFSLAGTTFLAVPDFIQAHFAEAPRFDDAKIEPWRFSWPTLANVKKIFKGDRESSARWRALKRLAVQGHDHMREMEFFKNEVRTRGWIKGRHAFIVALFGIFYGVLSDFGRSILRPVAWWVVNVALFWGLYLCVHLGHAKQPFTAAGWTFNRIVQALGGAAAPQLQCMAGLKGHPAEAAGWLSLQKALLLFGQGSGAKLDPLNACLYRDVALQSERFFIDLPGSVIGLGIAQHIVSAILFFLVLLAIRNHFRIK